MIKERWLFKQVYCKQSVKSVLNAQVEKYNWEEHGKSNTIEHRYEYVNDESRESMMD